MKICEDNLFPYFKKFTYAHDFKEQKLYNEACDTVIKKNLNTLQDIYKRHSAREALPGEDRFMSLSEFIDLITASGVVDDNFGSREIGIIFNLSMMT